MDWARNKIIKPQNIYFVLNFNKKIKNKIKFKNINNLILKIENKYYVNRKIYIL